MRLREYKLENPLKEIDMKDFKIFLAADCSHVGDGEMDEATKISLPASDWVEGPLYTTNYQQVSMEILFEPRACKEEFFPDDVESNNNDCLVLAINMVLRHPYFTRREQVCELAKRRGHTDVDEILNKKILGGHKVSTF